MCGTNIIDHNFFPGLIVSIMVAFMDTKLVIIEGDGDGWSSIYHSVCWICCCCCFCFCCCFFFFFFFMRYPNIPKDDWLQLFQIKLFGASHVKNRYMYKLLLSFFFDKPLQLITCKWLTSISISLHVEGKGLWVCTRMTI